MQLFTKTPDGQYVELTKGADIPMDTAAGCWLAENVLGWYALCTMYSDTALLVARSRLKAVADDREQAAQVCNMARAGISIIDMLLGDGPAKE